MRHLRHLLRKEFRLLRNSHFRSRKQAAATLGVLVFVLLSTGGIAGFIYSVLTPLVDQVAPALWGDLVRPLLLAVLAWLGLVLLASTIQESRNRFFLSPDLSLLVSTPVNPWLLFSTRFVLSVCLSPAGLFQSGLFGLGPLIGIGMVVGAPWYYYPLLVPITYVYLLIPSALGVAGTMVLLRAFSPKRLFGLAAVCSTVLAVAWTAFALGDQRGALSWLIEAADRLGPVWRAMLPLRGAASLLTALLGYGPGGLEPLAALIGSAALIVAAGMLVGGWAYYQNYERLQVGEWRPPGKAAARQATADARRGRQPARIWLLVLCQWKMAWRNREVAQGALGIGVALAGYVVTMSRLAAGAGLLPALAHIAVISFLGNLAVQIMFMPFAMMSDRSVLSKQFWPLKAAPVSQRQVSWSLFLAQCLPALPLGLLVLSLANLATGAAPAVYVLSLGLMLFVLPSVAAVCQLTTLLESSAVGKQVPLLARVVRELAPVVSSALILLPAAVGYGYRSVAALSFMHAWPQEAVAPLSILLTVLLALVAFTQSLRVMQHTWQALEIS